MIKVAGQDLYSSGNLYILTTIYNCVRGCPTVANRITALKISVGIPNVRLFDPHRHVLSLCRSSRRDIWKLTVGRV